MKNKISTKQKASNGIKSDVIGSALRRASRDFDKWIVKEVGIQDAPIFSKGSLVRDVAIKYAKHFIEKCA